MLALVFISTLACLAAARPFEVVKLNQTEFEVLFKEAYNTPGIWDSPSNAEYTYHQVCACGIGGPIAAIFRRFGLKF
jgi:hypothetical protein